MRHITIRCDDYRPTPNDLTERARRLAHGKRRRRAEDLTASALAPFDAEAWAALLDEQRRLIAEAAGVDPSKVRIQIGH